MPSTNLAPQLRAQFREIARDIISKDRFARKHGLSQNTIGEIERALMKAYTTGSMSQASDKLHTAPHPETFVDWIRIPPRSRETLIAMTHQLSERSPTNNPEFHQLERFILGNKIQWAILYPEGRSTHSIADGSVSPLIRMRLIVRAERDVTRYTLTPLGTATCQKYWARSDANDPTLPRQSLR